MAERAIRFGVGDPSKGLRASTWRCWTNGSAKKDVYVMCREIGGELKLSLHESGQWQVDFDYNKFPSMFEDGSAPEHRFVGHWEQARPIIDGIRLACRIYTPWNAVTIQQQSNSKVTWINPASPGHAVEVTIFLCERPLHPDDWPARRSMGTQLVGSFRLEGGGEVWIVHRCIPYTTPAPIKGIQPHYLKGRTEANVLAKGSRMLAWNQFTDGSIIFHDLRVTVTKNTA